MPKKINQNAGIARKKIKKKIRALQKRKRVCGPVRRIRKKANASHAPRKSFRLVMLFFFFFYFFTLKRAVFYIKQ